jgi:DNA-binding XRE family transcriptional regulator
MQNSDPTEKTLGQKLRSLRRHREKTPQQLADLLEISRSGYNKKEDGEGNFEAKNHYSTERVSRCWRGLLLAESQPRDVRSFRRV